MKHSCWKRLVQSAAVCGSLVINMASGIHTVTAASAPDAYHDDWLHVNENAEIVDMNGNPVWLTGCNWFGFNVGSQVFDGVWSQNMHDMLRQIADHGFNLLRVPMSTEILLQWKNGDPDPSVPKVNEYTNPELTIEGVEGGTVKYSFDLWNQAVEWCRELGIKIMIDIHSAETASAGHQVSLWYTDKFSTEDWCTALEWFADYYKDDDTILAIDLKNEPHGTADTPDLMAKWDDSTDPTNWKYAAETCAARVLAKNPNLLIMVEGTEVYPKFEEGADWSSQNIDYSRYPYSYYHHTWWGGNFRGAKEYPIDLGDYQSQLVYSPHDYGPLVWEQDWFYDGFTQESLLEDCWYDNWFYLQDEGTAPLLMGEWGGFMDGDRNEAWMIYLRDFMIENRIHHTFWCFNENSGDTGGLVYDNFGKWDEEKYALVLPSLWQDDSGRFISLDHTIALGANGITLSDYYNSNPAYENPDVVPGDVTGDGSVNVMDLAMAKHMLGTEAPSDSVLRAAPEDTNGDGTFTISDLVRLAKYLVGLPVTLDLYKA
ncbi:MAG: cellulase family glycosylhydrolase [Ruminococcus sp.]